MCGIIGFVGEVPEGKWLETYDILNALFLAAEHRGTHATGYVAMTSPFKTPMNEDIVTDKQPIRASEFIEENRAWRSLRHRRCSLLLGHVRWETHGSSQNSKNLHPHVHEDGGLHLVHNGVIADHQATARKHGLELYSECDSEVLIRLLEQYKNPHDGLHACLGKVTGSMSIAVFDYERECLWLARNSGRPLWIAKLKGDRRYWIASTRRILLAAFETVLGQQSVTDFEILIPMATGSVHVLSAAGYVLA
jgi:glucosamine 6-phosphate synthetase-like amidotransferase/phosphosugar isomerase protein